MTNKQTGWDIFEVDPFAAFDDDPAAVPADPAAVAISADPAAVVCYHCGQAIKGDVHEDHERWCNKPETGCQCAINSCAGCCEWCEREDFPTAAEWLVDKLTMEHPTAGRALINACWVLKMVRSGSLPGLRAIWTDIVVQADILVDIEAAVADAGLSLEMLDWKELRHRWFDAATILRYAGELDLADARPEDVEPAPVVTIEPEAAQAAEAIPWPTAWQRADAMVEGAEVFMLV